MKPRRSSNWLSQKLLELHSCCLVLSTLGRGLAYLIKDIGLHFTAAEVVLPTLSISLHIFAHSEQCIAELHYSAVIETLNFYYCCTRHSAPFSLTWQCFIFFSWPCIYFLWLIYRLFIWSMHWNLLSRCWKL